MAWSYGSCSLCLVGERVYALWTFIGVLLYVYKPAKMHPSMGNFPRRCGGCEHRGLFLLSLASSDGTQLTHAFDSLFNSICKMFIFIVLCLLDPRSSFGCRRTLSPLVAKTPLPATMAANTTITTQIFSNNSSPRSCLTHWVGCCGTRLSVTFTACLNGLADQDLRTTPDGE